MTGRRTHHTDNSHVLYFARIFGQARLPITDPGNVIAWSWSTPGLTLTARPGLAITQGKPVSVGYPQGITARLILLWICTEAVRSRSRDLSTQPPVTKLLDRLGVPVEASELCEQMRRLTSATWTVIRDNAVDMRTWERTMSIASRAVWPANDDTPLLPALYLSDTFFDEVTTDPLVLDARVCRAVADSAIRFDIYTWLVAHATSDTRVVSWQEIDAQFRPILGADARHMFEAELTAVLDAAPGVRVDVTADGITITAPSYLTV